MYTRYYYAILLCTAAILLCILITKLSKSDVSLFCIDVAVVAFKCLDLFMFRYGDFKVGFLDTLALV